MLGHTGIDPIPSGINTSKYRASVADADMILFFFLIDVSSN